FSANSAGSGGGLHFSYGNPVVTNCILWSNSPQSIVVAAGAITVNYSDVQGGLPSGASGSNNITPVDPKFVNAATNDFHLQNGSSCIDKGNNTAVPVYVVTDCDGHSRFVGSGVQPLVDMGSYEYGSGALSFLYVKAGSVTGHGTSWSDPIRHLQ